MSTSWDSRGRDLNVLAVSGLAEALLSDRLAQSIAALRVLYSTLGSKLRCEVQSTRTSQSSYSLTCMISLSPIFKKE